MKLFINISGLIFSAVTPVQGAVHMNPGLVTSKLKPDRLPEGGHPVCQYFVIVYVIPHVRYQV